MDHVWEYTGDSSNPGLDLLCYGIVHDREPSYASCTYLTLSPDTVDDKPLQLAEGVALPPLEEWNRQLKSIMISFNLSKGRVREFPNRIFLGDYDYDASAVNAQKSQGTTWAVRMGQLLRGTTCPRMPCFERLEPFYTHIGDMLQRAYGLRVGERMEELGEEVQAMKDYIGSQSCLTKFEMLEAGEVLNETSVMLLDWESEEAVRRAAYWLAAIVVQERFSVPYMRLDLRNVAQRTRGPRPTGSAQEVDRLIDVAGRSHLRGVLLGELEQLRKQRST